MSHSLSLLDAAREVPQRPALFAQGAPRSFADLALRTAALAAHLRASGIGPGSRVALIAQNRVETVLTVYALLEIGAAIVPVHPRLTPPEVTALLADGSSDLLLRDTDLDVLLDASGPSPSAALQPPKSRPDPSSLFAVVHTSGTTGRPKGAMLTRGNLLASAAASAQNLGFCDTDRWLACMPLCHIGGLSIVTRCLRDVLESADEHPFEQLFQGCGELGTSEKAFAFAGKPWSLAASVLAPAEAKTIARRAPKETVGSPAYAAVAQRGRAVTFLTLLEPFQGKQPAARKLDAGGKLAFSTGGHAVAVQFDNGRLSVQLDDRTVYSDR